MNPSHGKENGEAKRILDLQHAHTHWHQQDEFTFPLKWRTIQQITKSISTSLLLQRDTLKSHRRGNSFHWCLWVEHYQEILDPAACAALCINALGSISLHLAANWSCLHENSRQHRTLKPSNPLSCVHVFLVLVELQDSKSPFFIF